MELWVKQSSGRHPCLAWANKLLPAYPVLDLVIFLGGAACLARLLWSRPGHIGWSVLTGLLLVLALFFYLYLLAVPLSVKLFLLLLFLCQLFRAGWIYTGGQAWQGGQTYVWEARVDKLVASAGGRHYLQMRQGQSERFLLVYSGELDHLPRQIKGRSQFYPLDRARNPGGFDPRHFYRQKGIYYQTSLTAEDLVSGKAEFVGASQLYHFRRTALDQLVHYLSPFLSADETGLLLSLCFSDNRLLSDHTKTCFQLAGLSHLLAVSGSHLTFFLLGLEVLRRKLGRHWQVYLTLALAAVSLYACLCAFKVGLVRSSLCYFQSIILAGLGKKRSRLNILLVSSLPFLLFDPLALQDTGFVLSFLSSWALVSLLDPPDKKLSKFSRIKRTLKSGLICQAVISLYSLHKFGMANLLAGLWAGFFGLLLSAVFTCTLALILLSPLSHWLTLVQGLFADLLTGVLQLMLGLVQWIAGLPGLVFSDNYYLLFAFCLLILLPLVFLSLGQAWFKSSVLKGVLLGNLLVALLLGPVYYRSQLGERTWSIYFLDVGQGDACLLVSPDRTSILIDGGDEGVAGRVLLPAMHYLGLQRIDLAIVSHLHRDHAKGVLDLVELGFVRQLALPDLRFNPVYHQREITNNVEQTGWREATCSLKQLLEVAGSKACGITYLQAGDRLELEGRDDFYLEVLAPDKQVLSHSRDPNASSLILAGKVDYLTCLFTGDIVADVEDKLVAGPALGRYDVLKVGHHGSATVTGRSFVERTQPGIAVISCGKNHYGHPAPIVLGNLAGYPVFRTDRQGAIMIKLSDKGKIVSTWITEEEE